MSEDEIIEVSETGVSDDAQKSEWISDKAVVPKKHHLRSVLLATSILSGSLMYVGDVVDAATRVNNAYDRAKNTINYAMTGRLISETHDVVVPASANIPDLYSRASIVPTLNLKPEAPQKTFDEWVQETYVEVK